MPRVRALVAGLFVLVYIAGIRAAEPLEESSDSAIPDFEPEDDWKIIKEGQKIPGGLDVRINMSTGVKEARLLRPESTDHTDHQRLVVKEAPAEKDSQLRPQAPTNPPSEVDEPGTGLGSLTDLMNWAMRNTGAEGSGDQAEEKPEGHTPMTPEEMLELVHEVMPSDFDSMKRFLAIARNDSGKETVEARIQALDDIDFLLHQIDNANDFEKMKGLSALVAMVGEPDVRVVESACMALGTAMQNNENVQEQAMGLDAVEALLWSLRRDDVNADAKSQAAVLYAISSMIRSYSPAEDQFAGLGGYADIGLLMDSDRNKVARKCVNLVSDLFAHPNHTGIEKEIRDHDICRRLPPLLGRQDTDLVESTLDTMEILKDLCGNSLTAGSEGVSDAISALDEHLEAELASSESTDHSEYLRELQQRAHAIVGDVQVV